MRGEKPEAFGVIWRDLMLGHLSLSKSDAASAVATARTIRAKGAGKVEAVRAVRVPPGSDALEYLDLDAVPADAVAPEGVGWIEALKALGWQVELRGDLYAALAPHGGYNALLGYPTEGDAWAAARGYHNRLHGRKGRL